MKRLDGGFLLVVAVMVTLAVAICFLGYQQSQISQDTQQASQTAQYAVEAATEGTVSERVIQLPEDGGTYHTILLLHSNWRELRNERELVAWFKTEPALVSLTAQTKYWQIQQDEPLYERYAKSAPQLPAVMVMTDSGRTIYSVYGDAIPGPETVAAELVTLFEKRPWLRLRPWLRPRPCPCPGPAPDPTPTPDPPKPDTSVNVSVPVIRPPAEKVQGNSDVWAVTAVCCVLAGLLALGWHVRNRIHS